MKTKINSSFDTCFETKKDSCLPAKLFFPAVFFLFSLCAFPCRSAYEEAVRETDGPQRGAVSLLRTLRGRHSRLHPRHRPRHHRLRSRQVSRVESSCCYHPGWNCLNFFHLFVGYQANFPLFYKILKEMFMH